MAGLSKKLAVLFPALGKHKRHIKAWRDARAQEKQSYSQYSEDTFLVEEFKSLDKEQGIYLDIGANHPSVISNTYKLYRQGFKGIIVEPNSELINLHRKFRPRDIQVAVGCGLQNEIKKFNFSKTPVLSSFVESEVEHVWKTEYLPVYTVDTIVSSFDIDRIYLLSIDVESWNFEVLQSCQSTLSKTYIACIEASNEKEEADIKAYMPQQNFELIREEYCNFFFKNKDASFLQSTRS